MTKQKAQKKQDTMEDPSRRDFVKSTAVGIGATALAGLSAEGRGIQPSAQQQWDHGADVVIVGAGATGLPAAISARENGASVIVVEENYDIGGHAIQSGGSTPYGGGTSLQKKHGIEDSPEKYYSDLVNYSDFRFCDREIIRVFCYESAPTFEFLVAHGVKFPDRAPAVREDTAPVSDKRVAGPEWSGEVNDESPAGAPGTALVRPLEASARKLGVQFLLEHRMTSIIRESSTSGPVLGVTATHQRRSVHIQARKGVIIATGGHTSNVTFRRMFDPRLTEEIQVVGEPYSRQSADGELAALRIGAALWGLGNQTFETLQRTHYIEKPRVMGCRYGYQSGDERLKNSPIFARMGATGLPVRDYQNLIHVNQIGRRVVNEMLTGPDWWNACLAPNGGTGNGGGPIWAVFDAASTSREEWVCEPPFVDPNGWFFQGDTLAEVAGRIANQYQRQPMPPRALEETVARYNSFVAEGVDTDFGKPAPAHRIETPPFYAAWATPCAHDSLTGLRINGKCEVIDMNEEVIPGLYGGGESAGGFRLHGLARCLVQGRVAGREAALATTRSGSTV
jgi:hypothetical protein